jgi:hypothetical protein
MSHHHTSLPWSECAIRWALFSEVVHTDGLLLHHPLCEALGTEAVPTATTLWRNPVHSTRLRQCRKEVRFLDLGSGEHTIVTQHNPPQDQLCYIGPTPIFAMVVLCNDGVLPAA